MEKFVNRLISEGRRGKVAPTVAIGTVLNERVPKFRVCVVCCPSDVEIKAVMGKRMNARRGKPISSQWYGGWTMSTTLSLLQVK